MKTKILEKEVDDRFLFCSDHPSMRVAQARPENIYPYQFSSIADRDLHLNCKSSLCADKTNGIFGLNGGVPWLTNTDGELCLFWQKQCQMSAIFLWIVPVLKIIFNLYDQSSVV